MGGRSSGVAGVAGVAGVQELQEFRSSEEAQNITVPERDRLFLGLSLPLF
jgi:hypothetical protein